MKTTTLFIAVTAVCLLAVPFGNPAFCQDEDIFGRAKPKAKLNPVESSLASIEPAEAKRGETVTFKLTLILTPEWHTYPTKALQIDPKAMPFSTDLEFKELTGLKKAKLKEPTPLVKEEPALDIKELRYYEGEVTWEWPLTIPETAEPGKKTVKLQIKTQVCHDQKGCIPFNETFEASFTVSDAPAVKGGPVVQPQFNGGESSSTAKEGEKSAAAAGKSSPVDSGLLAFMLSGVFWGAISLVTPCVFPMIPITVSFFLKQSEKEHHRPLAMALVYTLTIVLVLTFGAILLLSFFQRIIYHWSANAILGLLFIVFALSLFGMYEIALPSGLARFTSARESRGGFVGTIFMALTFTIVSFACVAPFLGGFAGLTAAAETTTDWLKNVLGALAFSITFASPFFVLALFPSLMRVMPKSGSWLNAVKVVMGFVELAAALKFLRAGEILYLDRPADLLTYDFVLGLYIALCILSGLYLLSLFRLPHDSPAEHLGVVRMLFSLLFISLGLYLLPGLFKHGESGKQRPEGAVFAWLDSFLLPTTPHWMGNLAKALEEAEQKDRLVFVDFTGET